MSLASWVVRRSMRSLEMVEVIAEHDISISSRRIDRINERVAVDVAYIQFARDSRVAMQHYLLEISDIQEDKARQVAQAGTKLLENLPSKPRTRGFLRRHLVAPQHHIDVSV